MRGLKLTTSNPTGLPHSTCSTCFLFYASEMKLSSNLSVIRCSLCTHLSKMPPSGTVVGIKSWLTCSSLNLWHTFSRGWLCHFYFMSMESVMPLPQKSSFDLQFCRRWRLEALKEYEIPGKWWGRGGVNRQSQRCLSPIGCRDKQSPGFTGRSDISPSYFFQNLKLIDQSRTWITGSANILIWKRF